MIPLARRLALVAVAGCALAPAAPASAIDCYGTSNTAVVCTDNRTYSDCVWVGSKCIPVNVTVPACVHAGGQTWTTQWYCVI